MTTREETPDEAVEQAARNTACAIVRDAAELPDRTSPEDWPDAMLVTMEELERICVERVRAALSIPLVEKLTRERDEARELVDRGLRARDDWMSEAQDLTDRCHAAEARVERLEAALTAARTFIPQRLSRSRAFNRIERIIDAALSSSDAPHND